MMAQLPQLALVFLVALAGISGAVAARGREPGSAWLRELNSRRPRVPTLSIWSAHDEFVVPRASAPLDGARETALALPCHFGLLRAPLVLEAVLQASDQR